MNSKCVRLYGKSHLLLEEITLPPIDSTQILAKVVSDCICMSSHKAALQGGDHKRVPNNVYENPVIIGHEFCGEIVQVGEKWSSQFKCGDRFSIQPALNYKGSLDAPGYSYPHLGGNATYVIIPNEVMELGCLLKYRGDAYFYGSLAEPMSCIIGSFHASYHTSPGSYEHKMGTRPNGNMAILAGAGPMGLGAIDYAVNCSNRPRLLVVTDIDEARLSRAAQILPPHKALQKNVTLIYANTSDPNYLLNFAPEGYDDVFVMAPVAPVVQLADRILGRDGCLNFFAGPTNQDFSASINFYNVHYGSTHLVGVSGGNTADMREALSLMSEGTIDPASMITHVGGLDCVIDTTLNLDQIPGGKKLIYTHISMPLTPIDKLSESQDPVLKQVGLLVDENNGLWNVNAEKYLLSEMERLA